MSINHLDTIAIRKAGADGWEPYKYEVAGPDGFLVTGGIPKDQEIVTGPFKTLRTIKEGDRVKVENEKKGEKKD